MPAAPGPPPLRVALLAGGVATLVMAVWAGLWRMGWNIAPPRLAIGALHGPLMVAGFLGVVIGLERAVALARSWTYAAPGFAVLGSLLLIVGAPIGLGAGLLTLSAVVLVAIFLQVLRIDAALHHVAMALGAVALLVGNGLWWARGDVPSVVLWWLAFVVLTIAGERLELGRMAAPVRGRRSLFTLVMVGMGVGLGGHLAHAEWGIPCVGLSLIALSLWLARYDVVRRTVRQTGLPRFVAICLLSGYAWMALGGALLLRFGLPPAGPVYDATLHTLFLGFVFAMIFGHAPIVFPAVLRVKMPFSKQFYLHLALLQVSLVVRVAGDLALGPDVRRWGGLLGAAALAVFFASSLAAVARGSMAVRSRR
jgi:hypothetical protein